jgi:D-alanyl-D-alanine carboxypeptidase
MTNTRTLCGIVMVSAALAEIGAPWGAQGSSSPELGATIDRAVTEILAKTGAPSASIAVVADGAVAYLQAYGNATLDPATPATPKMRYSIGSISKQFTAAAVLMLAEEGRLALDDKLVRWFPSLTGASEVTIREILSMTSGYQDFWPEDYVMPMMLQPVTPTEILDRWARKPLDFAPGTRWQYSNTNYVIAGLVVERVSGTSIWDFLARRVFDPLHMRTVTDTDRAPLGPGDPGRFMRYALGPPRPAPKEGKGWMFAAGELAMTAGDLALWDISLIDRTLMQPASYRQMETEVLLANGVASGYGLGVSVGTADGHRLVSHGGEVSGFTARNNVYPDDRAAVVVLTNLDATNAAEQMATRIGAALFTARDREKERALDRARTILDGLADGRIERSLFTSNANAYFTEQALRDFAAGLAPLGRWKEFSQQSSSLRGGMTLRRYRVVFPTTTLRVTTFIMPDGKLEQYTVAATE